MLIAILILMIFNTLLIIVMSATVVAIIKDQATSVAALAIKHTDQSIEAATTALYNMDSIKQKVEMKGEFRL